MADTKKKKIAAVLMRSIGSIFLTLLCVIIFDFIFTVSGIWMSDIVKIKIIQGIVLTLLFIGLLVLMFLAGRKFFSSSDCSKWFNFIAVCVLPMVILSILFGISNMLTGISATILQYPCKLAAEVFLHSIPSETVEKILYLAVFIQNFLCCLFLFAGACSKKESKNKEK